MNLNDVFVMCAGSSLSMMAYHPYLDGVVNESIKGLMQGNDEDLTLKVLADTLMISDGLSSSLLLDSSKLAYACYRGGNQPPIQQYDYRSVLDSKFGEGIIDGSRGEYVEEDEFVEEDEYAEEPEEVIEENTEEIQGTEETNEGSQSGNDSNPNRKNILKYFSSMIKPGILCKRYSRLFSDGYEVDKHDGILVSEGIAKLSGSERVLSIPSTKYVYMGKLCNFFPNIFGYVECPERSYNSISKRLCDGYFNGKQLLYFPNKLLEYAYGRECASSKEVNQNSLNTYKKSSNASNWSSYEQQDLFPSIKSMLENLVYTFVNTKVEDGIDYVNNMEMVDLVQDFLNYCTDCLSFCVLFRSFKYMAGEDEPYIIKIRIGDPQSKVLGSPNGYICKSFMDSVFPMSATDKSAPRQDVVDTANFVFEFGYEFDRDVATATPLFAYKPMLSLLENGVKIGWNNIMLGESESGAILKSGPESGIDLLSKISHYIVATSRAGKGVMTLSLLSSGIASGKPIFYLDNKPDMAGLMRHICPDAFAVNGAMYNPGDDPFKSFGPEYVAKVGSLMNIPDYLLGMFPGVKNGVIHSNNACMAYFRAFSLIIGLMQAIRHASAHAAAISLTGEQGVILVVDEVNNLEASLRVLFAQMNKVLPPQISVWESESKKEPKKGQTIESYMSCIRNDYFSDESMYYHSFYRTLEDSFFNIMQLRNAGKDVGAVRDIDIILVGQENLLNAESGGTPFDIVEQLSSWYTNGVYKSLAKGLKSEGATEYATKGLGAHSIFATLADLGASDLFIGATLSPNYLHSRDVNSPAHNRLDQKAKMFAYNPIYNADVVRQVNSPTGSYTFARSVKYFKPYLLLNHHDENLNYVKGMYKSWRDASLSKEVQEGILKLNCDPNDPTKFNPCIGFEEYLKAAGVTNTAEVLARGGQIANQLVAMMGYPGSWLEFIYDLRPEWLFSTQDVVDAIMGIPLTDKERPYLKDWRNIHPEVFGGSNSNNTSDFVGRFSDAIDRDDYSEPESSFINSDEALSRVFNGSEEPAELTNDGSTDDSEQTEQGETWDVFSNSTKVEDNRGFNTELPKVDGLSDEQVAMLMGIIAQMRSENSGNSGNSGNFGYVNKSVGLDGVDPVRNQYQPVDSGIEFTAPIGRLDEEDTYSSLKVLTDGIQKSIAKTFGGYNRIRKFRVMNGSFVINDVSYVTNVSPSMSKSIPYDVRVKINSGQIADLFSYALIYNMTNLSSLEVDSMNFYNEYLVPQLGYQSVEDSINGLFKHLNQLMIIKIGKIVVQRSDWFNGKKSGIDDAQHQLNACESISWGVNAWSKKAFKNSLNLAHSGLKPSKDHSGSKMYRGFKRIACVGAGAVGLAVGGAAYITSGTAGLAGKAVNKVQTASKVSRAKKEAKKQSESLLNGIKNLFNS